MQQRFDIYDLLKPQSNPYKELHAWPRISVWISTLFLHRRTNT